ncbi:hypothetical protein H257_17498 [Aphanomyces astaci]|uniref:Uncharacterized protein n=1 Tax=Aphanomyces astaci TaxID=112090 RepID=W4FEN5_APHAT|nr:hypothetical protein H257_17498 [Aphanomyces astaci]ETV65957.1 hypothetical protein H257_17498 [Aphanomyces astaci]|eukprot:XP_009844612.1 hypothetical protein H257_17498 [Aphanomyces astaci]
MLPLTEHAFRSKIKDIVVPFEVWLKRFVQFLASHSAYPTRDHPTKSATRPDFKSARIYLRLVRKSMEVLSPVHADVCFRVLFGMLPVNSRFVFRQATDASAMMCAHGCLEAESQLHALFACPRLAPLWQAHQSAWRPTGVRFSWHNILNVDDFYCHVNHGHLKPALFQLWVMGHALPPLPALIDLSFVTWTATVRSWLRRLPPDDITRPALMAELDLLLRQSQYSQLSRKYPRWLELAPTFDIH